MKRSTIAVAPPLSAAAAYAGGPPLIADDAGSVEPDKLEIEFNGSSGNGCRCYHQEQCIERGNEDHHRPQFNS